MKICIREATRKDMIEAASINIQCVPNGRRALWGAELTAEYFTCFLDSDQMFLVAEAEGKIVGYVFGYLKDSNAKCVFEKKHPDKIQDKTKPIISDKNKRSLRNNDEIQIVNKAKELEDEYSAVLYSLCVLPEYAKRGIGKKLARKFSEKVAAMGGESFCLSTGRENIAGQRVYEGIGMKKLFADDRLIWYSGEC